MNTYKRLFRALCRVWRWRNNYCKHHVQLSTPNSTKDLKNTHWWKKRGRFPLVLRQEFMDTYKRLLRAVAGSALKLKKYAHPTVYESQRKTWKCPRYKNATQLKYLLRGKQIPYPVSHPNLVHNNFSISNPIFIRLCQTIEQSHESRPLHYKANIRTCSPSALSDSADMLVVLLASFWASKNFC